MAEKHLYFDESGFTGYNLLDMSAPVFVEASTDIGDEEAEQVLRTAFPHFKGAEFKFANIWRQRDKRSLAPFGAAIRPYADRIKGYTTDKKFAALTKAFDFLVEPVYRANGYNWYAEGYCWRYVNYAYFGLVHIGEPAYYDAIVRAWQCFSRSPNEGSLRDLQMKLRIMQGSFPEEPAFFAGQLAFGAERFHQFSDIESFGGSDEMQVSTLIAIVAAWRKEAREDFIVHHDESSNFFRRKELWEKIVGPDAPAHVHPLGDGSSVDWPLRVTGTHPRNSKDSAAIQLCDLLAGLAAKARSPVLEEEDGKFVQEVIDAGFGELKFDQIGFRPEFPVKPEPELLDGPDAVDLMVGNIFR